MFEASRPAREEWPYCDGEFELWPRHTRAPAALRPLVLAFGPLGLITGLVGTAISAAGSAAAGQNAKALGDFEQAQYAQDAMTDVAVGQRKMLDQQYRTKFIQSQLQARAAGGGQNPAVGSANILGQQIAGRGEYNSLMDLSQGQIRAAAATNMGSGDEYQGRLAESMVPYQIAGTIAGGAGSFFSGAQKLGLWG
jgi:hypothetical protein